MITITTVNEMKQFSRKAHSSGKTIGFVPTMGFLHEGHMSLVKASEGKADVTVVSIFVNPTQFGPGEDLDRYPRDIERDKMMLEQEDVDVLFYPSVREMYGGNTQVSLEVKGVISESLCGRSRPGHFNGVATIVLKLFNIVDPDMSFFGQKDAQQTIVIKKMASDLNLDVDICIMPIVRDADGLARSSRNKYLSERERHEALSLHDVLKMAKRLIDEGERLSDKIAEHAGMFFEAKKDVKLDYFEIVDADTLDPVSEIKGNTLIAVAAYVGNTRLIDNILV